MVLSAVGSLLSKTAGQTLAKEMISGYIGLAIVLAGILVHYVEPLALQEIYTGTLSSAGRSAPLLPEEPWVWVQTIAISLMGSLQQYFNICKLLGQCIGLGGQLIFNSH